MSKCCPKCGYTPAVQLTVFFLGSGDMFQCPKCGHEWLYPEEVSKATLFDRITASPEVLAPRFVYHITSFIDGLNKPKKVWYSTLINNQYFNTELEAKRATVAKLKEVVG